LNLDLVCPVGLPANTGQLPIKNKICRQILPKPPFSKEAPPAKGIWEKGMEGHNISNDKEIYHLTLTDVNI
jgi:hypothetical protein